MKPSKKFQEYLEKTSNWRFRDRLRKLVMEIESSSRYLENKFQVLKFEEVDYVARKLAASTRLLDRLITKKRKEIE